MEDSLRAWNIESESMWTIREAICILGNIGTNSRISKGLRACVAIHKKSPLFLNLFRNETETGGWERQRGLNPSMTKSAEKDETEMVRWSETDATICGGETEAWDRDVRGGFVFGRWRRWTKKTKHVHSVVRTSRGRRPRRSKTKMKGWSLKRSGLANDLWSMSSNPCVALKEAIVVSRDMNVRKAESWLVVRVEWLVGLWWG